MTIIASSKQCIYSQKYLLNHEIVNKTDRSDKSLKYPAEDAVMCKFQLN